MCSSFSRYGRLPLAVLTCVVASLSLQAIAATPDAHDSFDPNGFESAVKPFLGKYCFACHSGKSPAAGFNLKSYTTLPQVVDDLPRWTGVAGRLKSGEMPPKGMTQPAPGRRTRE